MGEGDWNCSLGEEVRREKRGADRRAAAGAVVVVQVAMVERGGRGGVVQVAMAEGGGRDECRRQRRRSRRRKRTHTQRTILGRVRRTLTKYTRTILGRARRIHTNGPGTDAARLSRATLYFYVRLYRRQTTRNTPHVTAATASDDRCRHASTTGQPRTRPPAHPPARRSRFVAMLVCVFPVSSPAIDDEVDDDGDPPRLWDSGGYGPGTAFTRSIGDRSAERIGVFAEVREAVRRSRALHAPSLHLSCTPDERRTTDDDDRRRTTATIAARASVVTARLPRLRSWGTMGRFSMTIVVDRCHLARR